VIALGGCANSIRPVVPTTAPTTIDFSNDSIGRPPNGFTSALTGGGGPIAWVVRDKPAAPHGGKVLVQESADDTSYRFPVCVYDAFAARDVAAEVQFQSISGTVDQASGLVLRYTPENYYIARANPLEDNINVFKTVNGKRLKIAEVEAKVTLGEWHTLGFSAQGDRLTVTFDGKTVIETNDTTLSNAGKVGLWTKADSVSAFTGLKMHAIP
jgi:hypothetical protein